MSTKHWLTLSNDPKWDRNTKRLRIYIIRSYIKTNCLIFTLFVEICHIGCIIYLDLASNNRLIKYKSRWFLEVAIEINQILRLWVFWLCLVLNSTYNLSAPCRKWKYIAIINYYSEIRIFWLIAQCKHCLFLINSNTWRDNRYIFVIHSLSVEGLDKNPIVIKIE